MSDFKQQSKENERIMEVNLAVIAPLAVFVFMFLMWRVYG